MGVRLRSREGEAGSESARGIAGYVGVTIGHAGIAAWEYAGAANRHAGIATRKHAGTVGTTAGNSSGSWGDSGNESDHRALNAGATRRFGTGQVTMPRRTALKTSSAVLCRSSFSMMRQR